MSNMEDFVKGLKFGDDMSPEQILNLFFQSEKNPKRKTKIDNPIELALLRAITNYIKKEGYTGTAKFLHDFQDYHEDYSVSQKGWLLELMSNTLSALRQQKQNSITNKLLGMEEK